MFNPVRIIASKRDGGELSPEEIAWFVRGFTSGEIPDYQMSALAMAIYLRGMTDREIAALTDTMLASGETLAWPDDGRPVVDKHSTGGVGDKVSLPLAPLLATCGVRVPMISGRGLGPTGGTLDKLEAIPGFRTNLSDEEIHSVVDCVGCVITGASATLAPADRKLYALRDVTATVASIPLITASIMSKKLAEGLDALVLDVKFGSGAFMKSHKHAKALAQSMVRTGRRMGVATTALLTDMNQPLGRMCGHAVEVNESLDILTGKGPSDVTELTLELGAELLVLAKAAPSVDQARQQLQTAIARGKAMEKLRDMVAAQGGNLDAYRPVAPAYELGAPRAGYVTSIDTERLGWAVVQMGGGRQKTTDAVDHSVGLEKLVSLGHRVERGEPIVRVFAPEDRRQAVETMIAEAYTISEQPARDLVVERIAHTENP